MKTLVCILLAGILMHGNIWGQQVQPKVDYPLNTVYYEALGLGIFLGSVNYDRWFPIEPKYGLITRIGLTAYETIFVVGELGVYAGGPKHFIEAGLGVNTLFFASNEGVGTPDEWLMVKIPGYRFRKSHGLNFGVAPYIFHDGDNLRLWPSIALGYAF